MPPDPAGSAAPTALRWLVPLLVLPIMAAATWFGIAMLRAIPPPALDAGPNVTVLRAPLPLPDFILSDHHGRVFDAARFDEHWSFVFFGYTYCPDVCPATLSTFRAVEERLADEPDLQYVFVSVDPERDTLERLAEFVPYFHPDFIGVTGPTEEIAKFTSGIGVYHQKSEATTGPDYLMDHSISVMLMDPERRLAAIFSAPNDPDAIAAAFRKIREHGTAP
ncbi:MAG: SCO family protein [Deltaproteobacteria bacterium]|nr:SCO family protein [Deltaproteobacteria bacterium]MBW2399638.1 SCO family protein [Deltaproteobacteria bacterium]MBW2665932.1 SCO family protein [Deltaproteobacteria bacterium]